MHACAVDRAEASGQTQQDVGGAVVARSRSISSIKVADGQRHTRLIEETRLAVPLPG